MKSLIHHVRDGPRRAGVVTRVAGRMLRGLVLVLGCAGPLTCGTARAQNETGVPKPVLVTAPGGRVQVAVFLDKSESSLSVPHYSVTFNNRPVILPSPLRVDLADGRALGDDCVVEGFQTKLIQTRYRQHPGKRSDTVDHCREAVVTLRDRRNTPRVWQIVVRAYDDGAAIRYRFPAQQSWTSLVLAGERTVFTLPEKSVAVALPLKSFTTNYESRYVTKPVSDVPADWLLGLPLLLELPGTGWAAITEANLTDFAGMYVARHSSPGTSLVSRLSPLPREPKVAVRASLPHDSPWRVIMVAEDAGKLVESDLVLNLNEPCVIDDVSWIRPGKTTFPWWNGYFEPNVPFEPGLNTATVNHYIDFCAEAGIPYHSLDGKGYIAWYGGPVVPYQGADPTRAIDGIDLSQILRHASAKGVRLRLWMHWQAAQAHMARAFPLYRVWGVEGVMIDFMDRDDQEMVVFMRDVLKIAAANHLTVTFHGCPKPTGLERTYPNLLTSEGVLNLEWDKWDRLGVPPEHEVTVPFTRMLAGPLDFHQGSFRTVAVAAFKPRDQAPSIMGTPCRTLASYVVFQNHLPMVADYPSAYRGHPGLPVLTKIPTTWDDTKVPFGVVGQSIVVARRRGDDWWIGAMTDRQARALRVPLDFLGPGYLQAELYRDDSTAKAGFAVETKDVRRGDVIDVHLAPAGGLLIRISPAAAK